MRTAYITHPICLKHDMGYGHPESPLRLQAIEQELRVEGLFPLLRYYEAPLVTHEQLPVFMQNIIFTRLRLLHRSMD